MLFYTNEVIFILLRSKFHIWIGYHSLFLRHAKWTKQVSNLLWYSCRLSAVMFVLWPLCCGKVSTNDSRQTLSPSFFWLLVGLLLRLNVDDTHLMLFNLWITSSFDLGGVPGIGSLSFMFPSLVIVMIFEVSRYWREKAYSFVVFRIINNIGYLPRIGNVGKVWKICILLYYCWCKLDIDPWRGEVFDIFTFIFMIHSHILFRYIF